MTQRRFRYTTSSFMQFYTSQLHGSNGNYFHGCIIMFQDSTQVAQYRPPYFSVIAGTELEYLLPWRWPLPYFAKFASQSGPFRSPALVKQNAWLHFLLANNSASGRFRCSSRIAFPTLRFLARTICNTPNFYWHTEAKSFAVYLRDRWQSEQVPPTFLSYCIANFGVAGVCDYKLFEIIIDAYFLNIRIVAARVRCETACH